jgi:hypothetical protein
LITSTSITRLIIYIKDIVGTKTKNVENHAAEDHNTENTVEAIIGTRPERNIIFAIRKNISLQNIIPKTAKLLTNNTINNLYI